MTLAQVQAFARSLYARGKIEALSYGNLGADDAVAAARRVATALQLQAVPEAELMKRRLLAMQPGQTVRTSEALQVNNSAFRREVLLGSDTPETRAATQVLAAFIEPLVYEELRTRQQLGYIVSAGAGNEGHSEFAYFLVQSGDYAADVLETRADAVIKRLPAQLEALPDAEWQAIVAGVRAKLLEKDKSVAERASRLFGLAYERDADWGRSVATLAALDGLTKQRTAAILASALAPGSARSAQLPGFCPRPPAADAACREFYRRRAMERQASATSEVACLCFIARPLGPWGVTYGAFAVCQWLSGGNVSASARTWPRSAATVQ